MRLPNGRGDIPRRRLMWLTLGLLAGLALTIAGLAVSYWLAFAAFVGVLMIGGMLEQELRLVSRDKLGSLSINAWLTGGGRRRRQSARVTRSPEHLVSDTSCSITLRVRISRLLGTRCVRHQVFSSARGSTAACVRWC